MAQRDADIAKPPLAASWTLAPRASNSIKGKLLTIRPAVVEDSPIVPVAWVCGNSAVPDKMTAKGVNKTNIPPLFLPLKCRPL
jgi:type IV pilus assembly protein PilA